jgi:hypothetical protein
LAQKDDANDKKVDSRKKNYPKVTRDSYRLRAGFE